MTLPRIEKLLNSLRQGLPALYLNESEEASSARLFCPLETLSEEGLKLFFRHGHNFNLLCTEKTLEKLGLSEKSYGEHNAFDCHFSLNGLLELFSALNEGAALPLANSSKIHLSCIHEEHLLQNPAPEARLLEAASLASTRRTLVLTALWLDKDGNEADKKDLLEQSAKAQIPTLSERDVRFSRTINPKLLEQTGSLSVELAMGAFELHSFYSLVEARYSWAFCKGLDKGACDSSSAPLVRLEWESLEGHMLGGLNDHANHQLYASLETLNTRPVGLLLYLRHAVDRGGAESLTDDRDYTLAAQMLRHYGVCELDLLTDHPARAEILRELGFVVRKIISFSPSSNKP